MGSNDSYKNKLSVSTCEHSLTGRSDSAWLLLLQLLSCFSHVRPHRRQPTRLPRSWDSLDKNTGVGYHFLLQCMKVKSESEVTQLCPTLRDPMDCSLPGSSIHGIFQARVLEWGAISFSVQPGNKAKKTITIILCLSPPLLSDTHHKAFHL